MVTTRHNTSIEHVGATTTESPQPHMRTPAQRRPALDHLSVISGGRETSKLRVRELRAGPGASLAALG